MSFDVWIALVILFTAGGLTPGPAVMLVLGAAFRNGFKPAMVSALGIAAANVGWLLLAVSGAAALAKLYPEAFTLLKFVGLAVIVLLALGTMFGKTANAESSITEASPRSGLFFKGLALQISSPMPLVYFGGLLPAYFDMARPVWPQFWVMLVTITATELIGLAVYAKGADSIRKWLTKPRLARLFNIIIGLVMILSGLWAVLSTL